MLDILAITGPIYLVILIGYAVTRRGVFASADLRVLGKFVVQMALPALLFNALAQRSLADILHLDYLLAYTLGSLVLLAGAVGWSRWQGRPMRYGSVWAMGMCCPNSGFVGYPIMLLTLGASTAGVSLALNMVVENLLIIPLLLALADMDADGHLSVWQRLVQTVQGLLRNPMIIGIAAGVLFAAMGWQLPAPLGRTVTLFAQASGVLSLLVIGGSLVGLRPDPAERVAVGQIALGKLLLHPLVTLALATWLVPVTDPGLRTALLLTTALPTMGIYTVLSQRYGLAGLSSASLLVTTIASFVSLSALLWFLRVMPGWLG